MLSVTKNEITSKLAVHGASSNGYLPRRNVGNRTIRRSRVPGGADDNDPFLRGVKRPDRYAVFKKRGWFASKGDRDDVGTVVDGGIESGEHVGVVALVAFDRWPTDFVGGDSGTWGATFSRAVALAEDVGSGDESSSGGGESVGAMAVDIAWRVEGGVERSHGSCVALVEVPCSDKLPFMHNFYSVKDVSKKIHYFLYAITFLLKNKIIWFL